MGDIDPRAPRSAVFSQLALTWVQIFALICAAGWALFNTCPHWQKQFEGESKLKWAPGPTPETCRAEWYVNVRNTSVRSIRVQRVDVRMWPYDLPMPLNGRPAYADEYAVEPQKHEDFLYFNAFKKESDPLVDEYAPNGVSDSTYIWTFPRPARPTWISMEVELYLDKDGKNSIWFCGETSQICPP